MATPEGEGQSHQQCPWHSVSASACAHIACPVLVDRFFRWRLVADPPRAPLLEESLALMRPFGVFVGFRRSGVLPGDPATVTTAALGRWELPHLGFSSEWAGAQPFGPSPAEAPVAALRAVMRVLLESTPGLLHDPGASLQVDFLHDVRAVELPDCISLPASLFASGSEGDSEGSEDVPPRPGLDTWSGGSGSPDSSSTLPFIMEEDEAEGRSAEGPEGVTPVVEAGSVWSNAERSRGVARDPERSEGVSVEETPDKCGPWASPRGYILIGTGRTRLTFIPQPVPGVVESEAHILDSLAARLREAGDQERPLRAFSFSVRRFSAPLFDVVRLLWRTSIGRVLRRSLSDFLRDRWEADLPASAVSHQPGASRAPDPSTCVTVSFEPAEIVRNARNAARAIRLERLVREEAARWVDPERSEGVSGAAAPSSDSHQPGGPLPAPPARHPVARFTEAFAPVAALQTRSGLVLAQAAALLLRVRGPAGLSETWCREAVGCVGSVLARTRMPAQAAYEMLGGLASADAPIPEGAGMWMDIRPGDLDLPALVARTLLATSPFAAAVARCRPIGAATLPSLRVLATIWERWCVSAMECGRPGKLFCLFSTEDLTQALLALSHLPAAVLGPGLRAAWVGMLGEACRRWLPALPFLVARPGRVRARVDDSLALALSSAV